MSTVFKYNRYKIGATAKLTPLQVQHLLDCFQAEEKPAEGILSGRTAAMETTLKGIGPLVIKPYFHGGVLRHINKRTYIRLSGKPRSRAEFEILGHVRSLGIYAPAPVAYAVKGDLFYHAWLVTTRIENAVSLSELCLKDSAAAERIVPSVARQVGILISAGIHHVDLHPGNILVDAQGTAWFIDFDRAKTGIQNRQRLFKRYVKRWKRAVDKYGLPGFVREALGQIESK